MVLSMTEYHFCTSSTGSLVTNMLLLSSETVMICFLVQIKPMIAFLALYYVCERECMAARVCECVRAINVV